MVAEHRGLVPEVINMNSGSAETSVASTRRKRLNLTLPRPVSMSMLSRPI